MADVVQWPKAGGEIAPLPRRIDKAADYGLLGAVNQMETQWGTIEAYNRLVEHCERLKAQIDAGEAKIMHPCIDTRWHRKPVSDLKNLDPFGS